MGVDNRGAHISVPKQFLNGPDVIAILGQVRGQGTARLVEVAAGGAGRHAPDLGFPQAVGNEVDDALPDLEGPRHAEEGGGLSAVFHKYGDVFFWRIDYRLPLRDGLPGLLRANGFVSAFMKCCT
jgi:hypothetical protein